MSTETTSYGCTFAMLCVAIATLSIGYGICFICLSGRFAVAFAKTFDTIVAGFVGFLAGFLVLSFLTLSISMTPLCKDGLSKTLGFDAASQTTNTGYVCWWCDKFHLMVGSGWPRNTNEAIRTLQTRASEPVRDIVKADPPAPLPTPAPIQQPPFAPPPPPALAGKPAIDANRGQFEPKVVARTSDRPSESLDEELARRHVLVNSPDDIAAAIANSQIRIIEVAADCTADKFDEKQAGGLHRWASNGGVVWANNDVLTLFGITHSELVWWGGGLDCTASQAKTAILADCQKVVLKDAGGKAHALAAKGAIPLLVLEKDIPFEDKAGTACWSLVPYGKGWISDTKAVDTTQYDGSQFWPNFCRFCLGKELGAVTAGTKPAVVDRMPASTKGPLSGTWQATTGTKFRIDDDGQTITIIGIADKLLKSFTGTLVRRDDDPASALTGKVDAVFVVDAHKTYAVDLTAMTSNADSMRVRCADWPVWNSKGRYMGTRPATDVWTRSESSRK